MVSPRVANGMAIDKSHVAKKDDTVQAAAASSQPAGSVDGALIKNIWPYVRCSDRIPGDGMIENEGNDLAEELKQELATALGTVEVNIQAIKVKYPDVEPAAGG